MKKVFLSTMILTLAVNVFAQKPDTELPVFTEVVNRLNAFAQTGFRAIMADSLNTKAINKAVDSLQYTVAQCEQGMTKQLDPDFKQKFYLVSNKHAIFLKYTTLSYLGQLASQGFFKKKQKIFDYLYSKYPTEKDDLEYTYGPYGNAWTKEAQSAIGSYNYQMLCMAYLMGTMKKQVAFAQELFAVRDSHNALERYLMAVFTIDGYLKNNMTDDIKKEWYKVELRPKELNDNEKAVAVNELDLMLKKNKKLTTIDKTGELSGKFAYLMFTYTMYNRAYELFTEAADAGFNLNTSRVDALNSALRGKMDNSLIKKLADNLVIANKKKPLGNDGWSSVVFAYNQIGDTVKAAEAKKNIVSQK